MSSDLLVLKFTLAEARIKLAALEKLKAEMWEIAYGGSRSLCMDADTISELYFKRVRPAASDDDFSSAMKEVLSAIEDNLGTAIANAEAALPQGEGKSTESTDEDESNDLADKMLLGENKEGRKQKRTKKTKASHKRKASPSKKSVTLVSLRSKSIKTLRSMTGKHTGEAWNKIMRVLKEKEGK